MLNGCGNWSLVYQYQAFRKERITELPPNNSYAALQSALSPPPVREFKFPMQRECQSARRGCLLRFNPLRKLTTLLLNPRQPHQNLLVRCRQVELRDSRETGQRTRCRGERFLDRAPDREPEQERRFADGFGPLQAHIAVGIVEQVEIEHRRQIADVRDLVRRRRVRQQHAAVRVLQLLGGAPAHPLDEGPEQLAAVDARVDRYADVHEHVDARDAQFAGEAVDLDLGDRRAVGEVEERRPLARIAVQVHPGRGIEPALAERDAFEVGTLDEFGKGHAAIRGALVPDETFGELHVRRRRGEAAGRVGEERRGEVGEASLDPTRRVERGGAVQVRAARRRGG